MERWKDETVSDSHRQRRDISDGAYTNGERNSRIGCSGCKGVQPPFVFAGKGKGRKSDFLKQDVMARYGR